MESAHGPDPFSVIRKSPPLQQLRSCSLCRSFLGMPPSPSLPPLPAAQEAQLAAYQAKVEAYEARVAASERRLAQVDAALPRRRVEARVGVHAGRRLGRQEQPAARAGELAVHVVRRVVVQRRRDAARVDDDIMALPPRRDAFDWRQKKTMMQRQTV